ncbi:MAG TPA: AMP-binding protein, partial [Herpetosiphonaceae bacterium]
DALGLSCRLTLPGRDAAQDLFPADEAVPSVTVNPEDLAYVAFTSGSTGAPKAILGTHRPLAHFLDWQAGTFGLTSGDRFSMLSGLAHDPLLRDVFAPLTIGATLCIPAPEIVAEPQQLARWLAQERISVAHLTPAHGQLLADAAGLSQAQPSLSALRYAFFGGAQLSGRVVARFQSLAPQATCINCYGATETPQVMGYYVVDPADLHSSAAIPLGRGIDGAQLLILNQAGLLAGVGERGEIAIRTPYLARGYLDDAALTEARFIANPFVPVADPLDRLYRTGDLGRYLPDGTVAFAGRADDQVKLRGFRVEPGEIESALKQHPDVRDAVVVAREMSGETRLVAYVVGEQKNQETKEQTEEPRTQNLEPSGEPRTKHKEQGSTEILPSPVATGEGPGVRASDSLASFLQSRLPSYMIPSAFVFLDALPLTPNGKVDRRALPEPDSDQLSGTAHVSPRTPTEEIVSAIWAEVLDRAAVGVHDNFFSLGGHSLLAARLMARLRGALSVDLPLRTLFEAPTVAGLSQVIERQRGGDVATEIVLPSLVVDPQRRGEPFPLTDIQQAYWIGRSHAFELGNVSTHTYLELEAIDLDLPRFNQAWQRLIERHEMLRAIVRADGTQQILLEVPDYTIAALDLRDQDAAAQATQIAAIRERMSHQMLPSDRWPLFEIRATLLDERRTRLHISMDALVSDAWSRQILARELSLLYEQPDAALPALELSFRDYVLAEAALHETELHRRSLAYWRERLPTLPPGPDLPLAQSPSALDRPRFVRRSSRLEPEAWRRLQVRAARSGLTPSGVLLAAFAEVLATWSKHPRFTINLTLFNRLPLHAQVNAIMGDFTSVTLLAVDLGGRDSFAARAQRLQAQLWDDLDHRYVSGVQVLRELARTQDGLPKAAMPVVFTSTLIQGAAGQGLAALNRIGEIAYSISQTPQVWLDHQVFEQAGALVFNWDAVEELFPAGLLDAMFGAYCALLGRLVADETTWQPPPADMIPAEQRAQRAAINATDAPISQALLHTLFTEQARRQPEQTAVITTTRTLSYADLNRRATELGHWLRERGARPNTLVAVVMEKGWEQVVAVLGVAMAGAAYLPIDPSLPTERLHYLLDHGQVALALTQPWLDPQLAWPDTIQRLCVDTLALGALAEQPLAPAQQPHDLAYVIYTSGSTGLPKGVMIDHRGAVNTILDLNA